MRIGDILKTAGIVDDDKLSLALKKQKSSGERLGRVLVDLGVPEENLAAALASQLNLPLADAESLGLDADVTGALSSDFLLRRLVFPLSREGRRVRVAMADPLDFSTIADLEFLLSATVQPVVATPSNIRKMIEMGQVRALKDVDNLKEAAGSGAIQLLEEEETAEEESDLAQLKKTLEAPPIVRMVNLMLYEAYRTNATDIHVERRENESRVRYRIDGLLQGRFTLPASVHAAVVSRLKVMAKMDISVHMRPQDGSAKIRMGGRKIDLRMSSLPTLYGEKMVVRLLGNQDRMRNLPELGMLPPVKARYTAILQHPQGFLIVTGPTGSGKSTTLYASLAVVLNDTVNVVTVEDPVEYQIPGVNQVQVNNRAGITFASGLRSILRQDPNIIMVGEIRDLETAEIAFQSSLTGHLVLSTLHANNAVSGFTRLFDLGIQPYLLASSLSGMVAQRLMRRLCPACSEGHVPEADVLKRLQIDPGTCVGLFYHGRGCPACRNTGFSGRMGVFEALTVTDEVKSLVMERASEGEILAAARASGMTLMEENATYLALKALTSAEEVVRILPPDDVTEKAGPDWPKRILSLFE